MAGIIISEDGILKRYEVKEISLAIKYPTPSDFNKYRILFEVFNNLTNERIGFFEYYISSSTANALYSSMKSSGVRNVYVELCTQKGISSSGVPSNMESEVI